VVTVGAAAITHVNPQIKYLGDYPAAPLTDGTHGGFEVKVKVHMWAAAPTQGTLAAEGSWGATAADGVTVVQTLVSVPAGDSVAEVTLSASASAVKLWWPAGQGAQPLYNVSVSFGKVEATRRVGFRTFAMVTGERVSGRALTNMCVCVCERGQIFIFALWQVTTPTQRTSRPPPARTAPTNSVCSGGSMARRSSQRA
jgi:hypothetical protein